jgi:Putative mono-oxygenase ydhR
MATGTSIAWFPRWQPVAALVAWPAMHALLVTYTLRDADPAQHAELCEQLAPAVAAVPGLLAKIWLTNCDTGRFGGFYVFASRAAFERYVASELFDALLSPRSVRDVAASEFSVADIPTALTQGPHHRPEEVT